VGAGPNDQLEAGKSEGVHKLFLVLEERIQQCNTLSEGILGRGELLFSPNSLSRVRIPTLADPELAFIRTVSWLYVQFIEAGGLNVRFLENRLRSYGVDPTDTNFINLVICLRTYHQHNLDYDTEHDRAVGDACEEWFRKTCGTSVPNQPVHYELCLDRLIAGALEFITQCDTCLRGIESDRESDVVVDQWRRHRRLDFQPEEFDRVISTAANDLGMTQVDPVKLRRRFIDQWRAKLQTLSEDADVTLEARKLVEDALIKMEFALPPVTGADILALGVDPGPRVGELLRRARRWFEDGIRDRNAILTRLRDEIERITG
jgi:hypothetical protein